jgi:uncharacterized protein (TIGR03083 family)
MQQLEPVIVLDLFPPERQLLLELLSELTEEDWRKPTICAGWTVKDIALHLLGDDIGLLSRKRDGFDYLTSVGTSPALNSWDELVKYINKRNDEWVQATRRMSSRLLCKLLALTGEELHLYFASLDPYAIGDAVSWAGPAPAPVWLDVAREYTERWVHQQHMRDAVNKPGLKEPRYFAPVLDTFVRTLPHSYKDVQANDGTVIRLIISGTSGGDWCLLRKQQQWKLGKASTARADATVLIDQESAWRLFTRGMSENEVLPHVTIEGNQQLGLHVLHTVSIIA